MTDLTIPVDLWDGDLEGVLVAWTYDDGARIEAGDIVAEVMVEKAQMELTAPVSGTLRHKLAVDDLVHRGDIIGTID